MTEVLEARIQRHPGLIFARAACSSLQHNSIVSCPRHRDLHGRSSANLRGKLDRTFAATGEPPRRARTSSASSNLHGKSRPSPAAHPSGRAATSRDLRGKPRPPPAAQPSGRATTSGTSGNLQATTSAHKTAEPKLNLRGEPLEAPLQAEPPLGKHRSL